MISLEDYLGVFAEHADLTEVRRANAAGLLARVNPLLDEAERDGVELVRNAKTSTLVSGEVFGGFRPQDCPIGAAHSNHKEGRAVDIYDPRGELDRWLTDSRLAAAGLAREHPTSTEGWCHLQDILPPSGHRTFLP